MNVKGYSELDWYVVYVWSPLVLLLFYLFGIVETKYNIVYICDFFKKRKNSRFFPFINAIIAYLCFLYFPEYVIDKRFWMLIFAVDMLVSILCLVVMICKIYYKNHLNKI